MSNPLTPLKIDEATRERVKIMFIAKNALWDDEFHKTDGNHAFYHREMRQVLEGLGLNLTIENRFEVLFDRPDVDFVFPLLNRAGFFNSEMLCPLLCERHNIPYIGASPIIRGLSDDKHLTKMTAVAAGVPTAPWTIYRRGLPILPDTHPAGERWVIKPNNSSASWGLADATDWSGIRAAVEEVHELGHDAIVEPFLIGSDVEVPVITIDTPEIMPMMIFRQADPEHLRKYEEKRDLVDRSQKYSLDPFTDPAITSTIDEYTRRLWADYRPFDYGRWEYRVNEETGEVTLIELNLNCNLWSQKVFGRAAQLAGWTQEELIETILADSLKRNGLMA